MTKIYLFSIILFSLMTVKAQVGINTETPRGALEVFSNVHINDTITAYSGLVLPIVDSVNIVSSPNTSVLSSGTLAFSKKDLCLAVRGNSQWDGCLTTINNVDNFFDYDVWGGVNFKARKLSAGNEFTLAIDDKTGSLYSSGAASYYRTGTGSTANHTFQLIFSREVVDASAGYVHGLLADKEGNLYVWGWDNLDALGITGVTYRALPYKISYFPENTKIIRVEAGYSNSLVMDSDGGVWFAGYGAYGLAGLGTANVDLFRKINFPEGVFAKDIALGAYGAAIVTTEGEVYTWGNSLFGRLGNNNISNTNVSPTKINLPSPVKKVIIGNRFGLAISADGKKLYGWGDPVGWGGTSIAAGSTSIVDISDRIFYNVESTDAHLASDFEIFDIATNNTVLDFSVTTSVAYVTTNKGIFSAGGSYYSSSRLGLGFYKGTGVNIYSPNGTIGTESTYTRFFMPLYSNSILPSTTFQQVSVGSLHSVYLQSVDSDGNGGFAQGTGASNYNQLGNVSTGYSVTPITVFLKK